MAQPTSGPAATTPSAAASAPAVSPQSTTSAPEAPEALPAGSPAAESAAVAKAAVQFPDAPAVKPASFGQLTPKHKYVAITLDDGYGFQPEMFELLQQYDARCTTFVLGSWASTHKSTLKELDEAGFEIANHTWDHKNLTKLSDAQVESELLRTQKAISAVTGNQAPYMRPPGGATNPRVKRLVADLGYKQVMWNRSFGDSGRGATTKKLYENVVTSNGGIKPGDIILCHWGSKATYKAMKVILPELKSQGYEFVTVSELIADSKGSKSSKK
jgi:peptidoglycan-N-acetylglucosamine deacetylase